ncbi:MAG: GNAT family N-acetyltransferase [Planctomycetota bacterium]
MNITFIQRPFAELTAGEVHDLLRLRSDVFLVEQGLTAEPDLDGLDPRAVHVLGLDTAGHVVATARLLEEDGAVRVGRVAVARGARGRGIGSALLALVHDILGNRPAVMSAQVPVVPWYVRRGWTLEGEPYPEAGVPHQRLARRAPREGPAP